MIVAAPMLRDGLSQWFVEKGRSWISSRWELVAAGDPSIKPVGPETLPLGYVFSGAGHVYARSAWNDPNATGAFFGGIAGAFFAARQGFISPESFIFMESAVIVSIVVLGGLGSQVGVAIAAVAMIGGTELLRELDFLKRLFGADFDPVQYRMLLFGLAMVILMVWRPRGLVTTRTPSIRLFAPDGARPVPPRE